jgi:4-amino-4-deoxy-L-arabinose transferase-like glycosyltransferase
MKPSRPDRRRRPSRWLLFAGAAVFALTFLLFYPRTFAIVDEDAYLTQAFLFRTGHLSYENSPVPAPHMTVSQNGRLVSKYPPGTSLFLLPFTLFGWRAAFVSGLLLALAGTGLVVLILRRLSPETDPTWALLYLCYPAVVIFSRTLMSDLLAGTAVLAAFYCLVRRNGWLLWSGLLLGFACLVRYSNAVFLPVFVALAMRPAGRRFRSGALAAAGFAPFAALILLYNAWAFGGPLAFPMYLTGDFSGRFFGANAAYYGLSLLLAYPLMLFAPLAAGRGRRLLLGLPAYALLLLYCFFSYTYAVPGPAARLTVGMRYLLPALPFFILGFAIAADNLLNRLRGVAWLRFIALGGMLALSVAIQFRHGEYLRVQDDYRRALYAALPKDALLLCNKDVSELVSFAWGARNWRHYVEFNVPVELDRGVAAAPTVYAGLIQKPGRVNEAESAVFETLVARFPARELITETAKPYRFRLYRLK